MNVNSVSLCVCVCVCVVCASFNFGFDGGMWDLIVVIFDNCLSFCSHLSVYVMY